MYPSLTSPFVQGTPFLCAKYQSIVFLKPSSNFVFALNPNSAFKKKLKGAKNPYLESGATRKIVTALLSGKSRR
jgi:hypothetical protein